MRFRQEIWLPAQPVVVARGGRGCGGGGAGGGVDSPRAALGGRTHRLCLDAARIRAGCRVGGYPAGRDRCGVEGTQRAVGWMSGDHDRCFLTLVLEAFRQVFFNTNALPCITIGADVWGESDIMTGVY